MKKLLLIALIGIAHLQSLHAQRTCGTIANLNTIRRSDPNTNSKMSAVNVTNRLTDNMRVNIPVIVHVLYNNATNNISDAQIKSQIDILNRDFNLQNFDRTKIPSAFAGSSNTFNIKFNLATTDQYGNPHTGIEKIYRSITNWPYEDMKHTWTGGFRAWDATKYLNIWIVDALADGALGYAQFPGTKTLETDGIVIIANAFGNTGFVTAPFNLGRTATHEVGHWLNLQHIWGDDIGACTGTDNVSDTPNQGAENYGCPSFPRISCNNTPNGDMFMNYMDYTDDACMFMFTTGQKNRARALFSPGGFRESFVPKYCTSSATYQYSGHITQVRFGSINNTSPALAAPAIGYTDFTNISSNMVPGTSSSLIINVTKMQTNSYFKAYIDYNRNGIFTDAGEMVLSSGPTTANSVTNSIIIPSTAVFGTTRLRVMHSLASFTSSCGNIGNNGEVEDYSININCSGCYRQGIADDYYTENNISHFVSNNKIDISNDQLEELNISLVTLDGKIISEIKSNEGHISIDMQNFKNGIYILSIIDGKGIRTVKKIVN